MPGIGNERDHLVAWFDERDQRGRKRRKRIAIRLYVTAFSFLVATVVLYVLSSDVHALVLGGMSTFGIACSATSFLIGGKK